MKPAGVSDEMYLTDKGLGNIEALVPTMAQDFELKINNAWQKSVQAHFKWTTPADVFDRANSIEALVNGAMCVDLLCKNLRAERAEVRLPAELVARIRDDRASDEWVGNAVRAHLAATEEPCC